MTAIAGAASPTSPNDALTKVPWALLVRVLAALATIGAGVALFAQTAVLPDNALDPFVRENWMTATHREGFSWALLAGVLVALVPALAYLAATRGRGLARLDWLRRALQPLALLAFVPTLLVWELASKTPLTYLCLLAAFTLALERTLRGALEVAAWPWRWPTGATTSLDRLARWAPPLAVVAGALFYAIYFSHYTLLNDRRLGTTAFDLGIHVNWAFNALHGNPWRCPVLFGPDGGHFIGNHAIFAMFMWLPIFALKPGTGVLLIYQASIVGAAAIPLYLFGRTQLPRLSAAAVALLFLLYAPMHGPNFYDYHELLPLMFWTFWLAWAIATRKNWLVCIVVPILYAHREDVAVGIAVLGVFLVVTGVRPRLGAVLAVVSVAWFITIKFIIMPRLWQTWFSDIYKDLQAPGDKGYGSVVQTVIINPSYFFKTLLTEVKAVYFFHIFLPLAFLPLRRAALTLLAIPGFFFTLLTTGYAPTVSIAFHYTMHWVPYVFIASILALRLLGEAPAGVARRRAAIGAFAAAMFFHSYAYGAIFQHHTFVGGFSKVEFQITPEEEARFQALERLAAMIPPDASVAATENEEPHISARLDAYTLRYYHGDAEYLLINAAGSYASEVVNDAFARNRYGLLADEKGIYLFKRDYESAATAAAKAALKIP